MVSRVELLLVCAFKFYSVGWSTIKTQEARKCTEISQENLCVKTEY